MKSIIYITPEASYFSHPPISSPSSLFSFVCTSFFTFPLLSHCFVTALSFLQCSFSQSFCLISTGGKKQVREDQHPLAVWLAEILDLLLQLCFSEQWNLWNDLLSWMLRDPLNVIERKRDQDKERVIGVMKGVMDILYRLSPHDDHFNMI